MAEIKCSYLLVFGIFKFKHKHSLPKNLFASYVTSTIIRELPLLCTNITTGVCLYQSNHYLGGYQEPKLFCKPEFRVVQLLPSKAVLPREIECEFYG